MGEVDNFWRWMGTVLTIVVAAGVIGIWNMSVNVGKMQVEIGAQGKDLSRIENTVNEFGIRLRALERN